jgi:hypothetical protein
MPTKLRPCDSATADGRLHHVQGDDHNEAIAELRKVGKDLARDLQTLLGMKTRAGYSDTAVTAEQRKRAFRAADRLVNAAAAR